MKHFFLIVIIFLSFNFSKAQRVIQSKIYDNIAYLSDDKLEGRATSQRGEAKTVRYIASQFKKIGLTPMGNDKFYYHFKYKKNKNPHDTSATNGEAYEASNVVGFLDNGAPYTIVIGAHHDHLGFGYDHNSLDPNPEGKIHNGADDNASGVAGVLALADYFANNKIIEKYNFLFMTFSGEELGLIGSKKWCENPTIPLNEINYMLNMDMIGRLNDSTKKLLIYGIGTSDVWKNVIEENNRYFNIKFDSSGVGPSDQTSFYLKDIPVLHFFTGQHIDYHKPSDDIDKINIEGEVQVLELMIDIIQSLDNYPKLKFFKTANSESNKISFKVTLGIMPDYIFDGKGVRIDGITDHKPAAKAGMIAGDIIIQFDKYKIENINDYMEALSHFKKGDKAKIIILRGEKTIEKEIDL